MWEIKLRVCVENIDFFWMEMADVLFFCLGSKLENPVKSVFEPLNNVAMSKMFMAPFFNRPRLKNLKRPTSNGMVLFEDL